MTLRRLVTGLVIAGGVFAAVLAATFPTDALVQYALARVTPPGGLRLAFAHAHLRPWGLWLDRPVLLRADGSTAATADWVTFRPSLRGILRDRTGRPWRATAAACRGTIDAVVDRDAGGNLITLGVKDVDLDGCPPLVLARERVTGRAEGSVRVRTTPTAVEGNLTVRDASWRGAGVFVPGVPVLHGDPAAARWTLGGGRLTLAAVELHGPEVELTGSGTVGLADPLGRSVLNLHLAIAPGSAAPPALRDLIERLPAADGDQRRLVVSGTLDAPRIFSP